MEDASLRPHRLIPSRVQVRCWTAGFTDCDNLERPRDITDRPFDVRPIDRIFDDPLIFELRPCIGARAAILKHEAVKTVIEVTRKLNVPMLNRSFRARRAEIISRQAQGFWPRWARYIHRYTDV